MLVGASVTVEDILAVEVSEAELKCEGDVDDDESRTSLVGSIYIRVLPMGST